jgi:cytochrome P450
VAWITYPNTDPFWAITKHADIVEISKQPNLWEITKRLLVFVNEAGAEANPNPVGRHLLNMNPPEHGEYRSIVSRRFTPRAVAELQPQIERIACEVLDSVTDRDQCDFVLDISSKIPLAVITELLGVPRQDWAQLFSWTNEIIAPRDPEFAKGATANETLERARIGLFTYFTDLVHERQKHPTNDITSIVAGSRVNGAAMPELEMLSYYLLLVVAGNETTRNATTGGLMALIENPAEFKRLREDPSLIRSGVEEIVRWVSPVIQFSRTATADTEIRGQKIREGESVGMFYPSANRDEEVFDEPFKFDVGRNPNPHIAFGIGEHFCLGANLARLELQVIFRQLAQRLESVEPTGPAERILSSFVGGIKRFPIRYRMRPAPAH